jgi:excisionase family DNA binding protein
MLKDLKDDYGYIRLSVNEKDLRKLRQALASEEQKRGGRPYHK